MGDPTAYLYGPRNRLLEVRWAGLLLETYRYDHRGLRVRRAGPEGVVHAVYDDTSLLIETDPAGNTLRKYDYGPDRLLSLAESTGERRFFLFDALGSVTDLVSPAGAVEDRYVYDAWGNLRRMLHASRRFEIEVYSSPGFVLPVGWSGKISVAPRSGRLRGPQPFDHRIYGASGWPVSVSLTACMLLFINQGLENSPCGVKPSLGTVR